MAAIKSSGTRSAREKRGESPDRPSDIPAASITAGPITGISPFKTASELLKEGNTLAENERRIGRWADQMIRGKKLAPGWKEDRDAAATVRWIGDRNAQLPDAARSKKGRGKHQGKE
ncbi:MAG TPA: hypothetical protein VK436_00250 [Methanocella sp.]|nr:hypothetical protein [Methanocella sp.]